MKKYTVKLPDTCPRARYIDDTFMGNSMYVQLICLDTCKECNDCK